jgi:protein-tyrosine phosphatase
MAEAVFKDMVRKAGLEDRFHVESAGTSDEELGNSTHPGTVRVLKRNNIHFQGYARQVTHADLQRFDYVLAMDRHNLANLRYYVDGSQAEVRLFLSYARQSGAVSLEDVPDPWYDHNYERTYDLVTKGCRAFLDYLRDKHSF